MFKHQTQPTPLVVTSDGQRRLQLALEAQIVAAGAAGVLLFNGRSGSVTFTSGDLLNATQAYMPISIVDLPTATPAKPLLRWYFTAAVTFVGGIANAAIGASSTSVLRVFKDGVANGTVSFTGTTGTVAITTLAYPAGSLFELYPPTTIDATLDRVSITLEAD